MRLVVREDLGTGFGESAGSFPAREEKPRGYDQGPQQFLNLNLLQEQVEGLEKCRLWDPTPRALHSFGKAWGLICISKMLQGDADAACPGNLGEPLD